MLFKVGDKVRITRRDGEGCTGTVTKVSEIDNVFPYTVEGEDGAVYVKEEKSLEAYTGDPVVKKKRGRKPGTKVVKKEQKTEEVKADVNKTFADKYREFMSTLTLDEFFQLHEMVVKDYHDANELLYGCLGLKQNDE